jgi:wyosine [tRNA(Phe)-imidazoG37] synthetase (radical SAM superfamily)
MNDEVKRIAFGPVPSRRLGQSIGINNIPPKICTYSCIYCQLGRTYDMRIRRQPFYKPQEILQAIKRKIQDAGGKRESIDYLTFVSDGEPSLDSNLGKEIELLRELHFKIAVITNASLIWKEDVRADLCKADWVSLKIDTVNQEIWHRINQPHGSLKLKEILSGISEFTNSFIGDVVTETMLIQGVNDEARGLEKIADFIKELNLKKSYISIPIRPPAETWVNPAGENEINNAYQIFRERGIDVEYLIGYEGNAFAFTGNMEEDLLSITSVHPMREDGVQELLSKANADWVIVEKLLQQNKLIEVKYNDKKFYMRKLPRKNHANRIGEFEE